MRADPIQPQGRHRWVVRLSHRGRTAPGSVGPFLDEDEATAWAEASLPRDEGWAWELEVVVSPAALPLQAAPEEPARRRHLRLVQ